VAIAPRRRRGDFFTDGAPTIDNAQLADGTTGIKTTDAKVDSALAAADEWPPAPRPASWPSGSGTAPNLERVTGGYPRPRSTRTTGSPTSAA
jgi:hypothetical protein